MKGYEELKKRIQAVNPEIMDLKLGCKLKGSGDIYTILNIYNNDCYDYIDYIAVLDQNYNERKIEGKDLGLYTMLGRDITIADILIYLSIVNVQLSRSLSLRFYYKDGLQIEREGKLLCVLDLTKELDRQEGKAKQFLIDIGS